MRSMKMEFPEFPELEGDVVDLIEHYGFTRDTSWHNDTCPSFVTESLGHVLYIEHPRAEERESPDAPRFSLYAMVNESITNEPIFTAQFVSDLAEKLKVCKSLQLKVQEIKPDTITQSTLSVDQARSVGLIDGRVWTEGMATSAPEAKIYGYSFGGLCGGHMWNEKADFDALVEFQSVANDLALEIWGGLQDEFQTYLDEVNLRERATYGYHAG